MVADGKNVYGCLEQFITKTKTLFDHVMIIMSVTMETICLNLYG